MNWFGHPRPMQPPVSVPHPYPEWLDDCFGVSGGEGAVAA